MEARLLKLILPWEHQIPNVALTRTLDGRTFSWLKVKQPRYREGERGWEPQKS